MIFAVTLRSQRSWCRGGVQADILVGLDCDGRVQAPASALRVVAKEKKKKRRGTRRNAKSLSSDPHGSFR